MKCPKCGATMTLEIQDSEFGDKHYVCPNCGTVIDT